METFIKFLTVVIGLETIVIFTAFMYRVVKDLTKHD